jgi:hypothetical protein
MAAGEFNLNFINWKLGLDYLDARRIVFGYEVKNKALLIPF